MEVQLTLTIEEINLILNALGEIPLKISAPVFTKIKMQIDGQMNRPNEKVQKKKS